jgi:hypothetical protein
MIQIMYNWIKDFEQLKKSANASADLEKAFIDLSYNAVAARAGRLMEDPYRIGFEVVYSNDDNSKMAGMYAFRIGKNLVSVPVIFTNGVIKGTEMMYEHKLKMMRPLDPVWVEHLINKTELKEGEAMSRDKADQMIQNPRLSTIASPQNLFKRASADDNLQAAWEEAFDSIENTIEPVESGLKSLVQKDAEFVMSKIAGAIEKSFEFAEAVANIDEETLFPEEIEKRANPTNNPDIEIVFDIDFTKFAKEDLKEYTQKGYQLWDMRKEDELNYVMDEVNEAFSEASEAGEHTVLTDTGEEVDVILGYSQKEALGVEPWSNSYRTPTCPPGMDMCYNKTYKKLDYCRGGKLVACVDKEKETSGEYLDTLLKDTIDGKDLPPTSGYVVPFNTSTKVFGCPFSVVEKVKEKDNVYIYKAKSCKGGQNFTVAINKDLEEDDCPNYVSDNSRAIFSKYTIFLPLTETKRDYDSDYKSFECPDCDYVKMEDLWKYLKKRGVKKVTLKVDDMIEECKVYENEKPLFTSQGDMLLGQTKIAGFYNISFNDAERMIKLASNRSSKDFYLIPNIGFEKKAAVFFSDRPNFQKDYDNSLAVLTDNEQTHVAESERTVLNRPVLNMGYGMNLNQGVQNGMLSEEAEKKGFRDQDILDKSPEELAQMAGTSRVSNLFEHGLVGSLVTTYDSAALIENYLPSLEKGLDHFGRILFLLYWKPADFEKLYGSDDMPILENKLKSQFKSMGDLVLDLIKKNEKVKGTVATP